MEAFWVAIAAIVLIANGF